MFKKPFNVKSNTNVRNSDRRKIVSKIGDNALEVVGKAPFSVAVVNTAAGPSANLYICEKEPLFFESGSNGVLFPTVYLAWKIPKVFPTLMVSELVLGYIQNGADLMLPGVLVNERIPLPDFPRGTPICISTYSERHQSVRGPIAVGMALMSSQEMIACGMKGKGIQVLHYYQDELWDFGSRDTVPIFDVSDVVSAPSEHKPKATDEGSPLADEVTNLTLQSEETPIETVEGDVQDDVQLEVGSSAEQEEDEGQSPEEFLRSVFLYALRYKLPADQKLPLDVGQFYANFVLKSLPEGRKIDMKKTKYKKFSTFLQQINETAGDGNWFVKVTSKKGLDSITQVNLAHPEVQNAPSLTSVDASKSGPRREGGNGKIKVAECFTLTEASMTILKSLFPMAKLSRGQVLQQNEVTELVRNYVSSKGLDRPGSKAELDDALQTIMCQFTPATVAVNDIAQKIASKMTKAFMITAPDGRRTLRKTKMPEIVLSIERRSGNKSVTLISNLSPFGIDSKEFSQKIQTGVATGATIVPQAPNCDGPQVLVNGNQINFISGLLMDGYGLQKKYIKGMELGVTQKKGKK